MRVVLNFWFMTGKTDVAIHLLDQSARIMEDGVPQFSAIIQALTYQIECTASLGDYQMATILFIRMSVIL